ncbi:unnamed protein product, partial [Discosporangium mesarthrocarpum]
AVSRVVTAPLDVAKIRYQLDVATSPRYTTLWTTMVSIYGEEGAVSLWRGNVPAMMLWVTYTGVQFGTYGHLRNLAAGAKIRGGVASSTGEGGGRGGSTEHLGAGWNFVCGSLAGGVATVVSYPLDITRTAMTHQGVPKRYPSMGHFVTHTWKTVGATGFFRGVSAALTMIIPQMGVSFSVYEAVKKHPPPWARGDKWEGGGGGLVDKREVLWQLVAGAVAGASGKLAVFPLDTVKRRVQAQVR